MSSPETADPATGPTPGPDASALDSPAMTLAPEDGDLAGQGLAEHGSPPHGGRHGRAGGRRRPTLYLAAALVVVLAFGSGIVVGRATAPGIAAPSSDAPAGSDAANASETPASSAPRTPGWPLDGLPSDGPLLGSRTAKVQLTYWADYQCPFCARFSETVLPQLVARIADGTVAVTHRDFVFIGTESLDAAIAVRCAGEQGKYWQMHDAVYAAQNGENQGAFSSQTLSRLANGVGVDGAAYASCTQRRDVLVDVLADTAAGVRASVSSTPTVDIPGRTFLGVADASELLAAIDAAATSGTAPTPAPSVRPSGDPWSATDTIGRTAGAPSSPVTVELWVDYQATGMPAIAQSLEPELRTRIVAGTVQVILRDLASLGAESTMAASLVRCGADDGEPTVWFAHDILSVAARGANAGVFTTRSLLWLGAKLGWDVAALDACMTTPATAAAINAETAAGRAAGLSAAPAVVVRAHGKEVARFSGSSLDVAKVLAAVDSAAK